MLFLLNNKSIKKPTEVGFYFYYNLGILLEKLDALFIIEFASKFGIPFDCSPSCFFLSDSSSSMISFTIFMFSSNIQNGHSSIETSWVLKCFWSNNLFFNICFKGIVNNENTWGSVGKLHFGVDLHTTRTCFLQFLDTKSHFTYCCI